MRRAERSHAHEHFWRQRVGNGVYARDLQGFVHRQIEYLGDIFAAVFDIERLAELLMLDVHQKGRAVVSTGPREKMEHDTEALQGYGLWATFQKDE